MSALIFCCATSMSRPFYKHNKYLSKMSFFVCPKLPIFSKVSSNFLIFVQISSKIVNFVFMSDSEMANFAISIVFRPFLCPYWWIFTQRQHSLLCRCLVLAIKSVRPSVHLCVCLSVIPCCPIKPARTRITKPLLYGPRRTLLSGSVKVFYQLERGHPDQWGWMRRSSENLQFATNKSPYVRNGAKQGRLVTINH